MYISTISGLFKLKIFFFWSWIYFSSTYWLYSITIWCFCKNVVVIPSNHNHLIQVVKSIIHWSFAFFTRSFNIFSMVFSCSVSPQSFSWLDSLWYQMVDKCEISEKGIKVKVEEKLLGNLKIIIQYSLYKYSGSEGFI